MQLKESYTLLDQMLASKEESMPLHMQRNHARVALRSIRLQTSKDMAMLVYLFNSLWVARELGMVTIKGNVLPLCKLLLNEAKGLLAAEKPLRHRHLCASNTVVHQYLWLLQELSQSSYIQLHREVDKRTSKNAPTKRTAKPRRR